MRDSAAQKIAQNISALDIGRQYAIGYQKHRRTQMIGNDTIPALLMRVWNVHIFNRCNDRRKDVRFKHRFFPL